MDEGILASAIEKEIQAREFYTKLSEKIASKNAKQKISQMAKDEASHASVLSRRFSNLFKRDYTPRMAEVDPKYRIVESEISSLDTSLQIVSLAIGMENESIQLYSEQLKEAEDSEDKKILKRLLNFERGHKRKLQNQHDRLNKGFSWI
jgi:rubrerythrin